MKLLCAYWKDCLFLLTLACLICVVFWWVPYEYFQQDEFYLMGQYMLAQKNPWIIFRIFSAMHFLPVELIWIFFQFKIFWLNSSGYYIVGLCTHITVAFLAYILLRMIGLRRVPSFLGISFFAVNPVSAQGATWFLAAATGGLSIALFLTGIIMWIQNSRIKSTFLNIVAGVLFFCALLAKEDVLFEYIGIWLLSQSYLKGKHITYKPVFISLVLWIGLYVTVWIISIRAGMGDASKNFSDFFIYISHMPEWMGMMIVNHNALRRVLTIGLYKYHNYFSFIDNDIVLKNICFLISSMVYIGFFLTGKAAKLPIKKMFLFFSLLVLILIPYFLSISDSLESRHFYIAVLFMGIGIALFLDWLMEKKFWCLSKIYSLGICLCLLFYGYSNQPWDDYLPFQEKRKTIVQEMEKIIRPTSENIVYYVEHGDAMPFQSGAGHMLLVFQSYKDKSFVWHFETPFLWKMNEQGYQKLGKKGFGYYWDIQMLKADYQKSLFDKHSIRAYSYDRNTLQFKDITEVVVKTL